MLGWVSIQSSGEVVAGQRHFCVLPSAVSLAGAFLTGRPNGCIRNRGAGRAKGQCNGSVERYGADERTALNPARWGKKGNANDPGDRLPAQPNHYHRIWVRSGR